MSECNELNMSPGSVEFQEATWEESCDECIYQEGRHYCLLHSMQVKNMDSVKCGSFKSKYSQNAEHIRNCADQPKEK